MISGNRSGAGGKNSSFGDVMVNEDCYGIITLGNGEFSDEIHGDHGEGSGIGFRENQLKQG